jgi:hypothetical protein
VICWQKRCPHRDHDDLILAGRTKSGARWFWAVAALSDGSLIDVASGYAGTEAEAVTAYTAAAEQEAAGRLLRAFVQAGVAVDARKRLNDAQRASRPAPDTVDATPVEYLYGVERQWGTEQSYRVIPFQITRRTAKRVFYLRGQGRGVGSVDRSALERDGVAINRARHAYEPDCQLYATIERAEADLPKAAAIVDLKALRRAAADAHPDRGGTHEAFLAANARYEKAKKRAA